MNIIIISVATLIVISAVVLVLVLLIWKRKVILSKNLKSAICPSCGNKMPDFRSPFNLKHKIWSRLICHVCGCELRNYSGKEG